MTKNRFSPIHQDSLKDAVYADIRKAILRGDVPAGSRLSEAHLSRSMEVSRAPIREALIHLEQDGLVERRPNRGTFVTSPLRGRDIEELTKLRILLEEYALSEAVNHVTPEELDAMDALLARMAAAVDQNDLAELTEADYQLHLAICRAAKNHRLVDIWRRLAGQYWALHLTNLPHVIENYDFSDSADRHRAIVNGLREGDLDAAISGLRRNLSEPMERRNED